MIELLSHNHFIGKLFLMIIIYFLAKTIEINVGDYEKVDDINEKKQWINAKYNRLG